MPSYSIGNDILKTFSDLISKYGWTSKNQLERPPINKSFLLRVRGYVFYYEFPEGDGYRPHIGFYELTFKDKAAARRFSIDDYKHLFPRVVNWKHHEYIRWRELRNENIVYIVYAYPVRQDIDIFYKIFSEYVTSCKTFHFSSLESRLRQCYEKDRELFHATKMLQVFLKKQGLYYGTDDGIYGEKTKKGLQRFLKEKGFYKGEADGLLGKSSRDAIKEYQKSIGIKTTGSLNLKTATAMQRQNTE